MPPKRFYLHSPHRPSIALGRLICYYFFPKISGENHPENLASLSPEVDESFSSLDILEMTTVEDQNSEYENVGMKTTPIHATFLVYLTLSVIVFL